MTTTRTTTRGILALMIALSLSATPGLAIAATEPAPASQGVVEGTARSESAAAPDRPATVRGQAPREGGAVADELHRSAKGFGEAILDSMKFVGGTITGFFTGSPDKNRQ